MRFPSRPPVSAATTRTGPVQGLSQGQRSPVTAWVSVRPVHQSVQITMGSGLASGSRLPQKPAASRKASTAKEARLAMVGPAGRRVAEWQRGTASARVARAGMAAISRNVAATTSAPPIR